MSCMLCYVCMYICMVCCCCWVLVTLLPSSNNHAPNKYVRLYAYMRAHIKLNLTIFIIRMNNSLKKCLKYLRIVLYNRKCINRDDVWIYIPVLHFQYVKKTTIPACTHSHSTLIFYLFFFLVVRNDIHYSL